MKDDYIIVNDKKHPVCIHYENRKTSRVSIGKNAVYIRLPEYLTSSEKQKHIRQFKAWAYKKLLTYPTLLSADEQKKYNNGDIFLIQDEKFVLALSCKDKKSSSGRIVGNEIRLCLSSGLKGEKRSRHISILLNRCFAKNKLAYLKKRVAQINAAFFGFVFGKVAWKNTRSRWGSCSPSGNLNFSTRLLLAPIEVLDYVIIHELSHIKHGNHGKLFWRLVSKAMPSWKEKRKWLRMHQATCRL